MVHRVGVALFLLVALCACDRRLEPWVPPEEEPPAPERAVRIPGLGQPPARVATLDPGERAGLPLAPDASSELAITGELRLAPGRTPPSGGVLFLIARAASAGPPLAVKRLPTGPFPMSFRLGPEDVMIPGQPFAGPLQLVARIDADGDPLTRGAEDWTAQRPVAVRPGQRGVDLVLAPN